DLNDSTIMGWVWPNGTETGRMAALTGCPIESGLLFWHHASDFYPATLYSPFSSQHRSLAHGRPPSHRSPGAGSPLPRQRSRTPQKPHQFGDGGEPAHL